MLISRTSIKILLLLIMAICYQITTKNNSPLYLQLLYAVNSDDKSTESNTLPQNTLELAERLKDELCNFNQARTPSPQTQQDQDETPPTIDDIHKLMVSKGLLPNQNKEAEITSSCNDDDASSYSNDDVNSEYSNYWPDSEFDDFDSDVDDGNISGDTNYSDSYHYDSVYSKSDIDNTSASSASSTAIELPPPPPPPPPPSSSFSQSDSNTSASPASSIAIELPLPPPPPQEELDADITNALAGATPKPTSDSQLSDTEADQQGEALPPPPPPLKKDQATQTEDVNTAAQPNSTHEEKIEDDENDSLIEPNSFSELQENTVIDHTNATQYHNTSGAIIHYTSIPMKVVNNFISRKVNNRSSSQVRYIGASESNSILRQKKYELECKYVYNATTIPQKNALGKASTIGAIINLKYQLSSKFTFGAFYAPTVTTYTMHNQGNNNSIAATTKDNIINHCIGMYTSYAIMPATYLSNQVSVGFSTTNDKNRDKNDSKKYGNPHCFTVDSFVSHKAKIDDTKTISPFLGLSYYSANPRLYYNIGDVNNLSLVMGVKLQYEYKYKDLVFAPWLKITHTRSLYSNISAKIQNKSITAQGEHLIDLLRDFHVAFNPNSSITLALSIRRRALRFAAGYEYSIHHECNNSYSHTFFARINIAF